MSHILNQKDDGSSSQDQKRRHDKITLNSEDSAVQDSRVMRKEETDELAERDAMEKEIAALNASIAEQKASIAEQKARQAEQDARQAAQKARIAEQDAIYAALTAEHEEKLAERDALEKKRAAQEARYAVLVKGSMGWLIDLNDDETFKLTRAFGESKSCHGRTPGEDATSTGAPFELDAITYRDDRVNCRASCILAATQKSTEYSNAASVQNYARCLLLDAMDYLNCVATAMGKPFRLQYMPETSIFTNKPDHFLVYTNDPSRLPIMCVEVERPTADPNDVFASPSIRGNMLDYLMFAKFTKGTDSFGVLTTFNDSKVVWLDHQSCNELATVQGRLQKENLEALYENLIAKIAADPSAKALIASPAAAVASPNASVEVGNKTCCSESTPVPSDETPFIPQRINTSEKTYKPYQLLAVFCNAMVASLEAGHKKGTIYKDFEENGKLEVGHLVLHLWTKMGKEPAYKWHALEKSIEIKGQWKFNKAQKEFFLVQHLRAGSTHRVWRAAVVEPSQKKGKKGNKPETGYACVIKYWIMEYDLEVNEQLTAKTIEDLAREATIKEVKNYQTIYGTFMAGSPGCDLCSFVGSVKLNSRWCTILPFFHPLQKHERNMETLKEIKGLLLDKFYVCKKSYQFNEWNQYWRHVGKFKGKVVLFDLADLQEKTISREDHKQYVEAHIAVLKNHMELDLPAM